MDHYPAASETDVVYNMNSDWFEKHSVIPSDQPIRHVWSTKHVPESSLDEFFEERQELLDDTDAAIRNYLEQGGFPEQDEKNDTTYDGPYDPTDPQHDGRTQLIPIHHDLVTLGLIEALQQDVLARNPFWRIRLQVAGGIENDVLIYPDRILFGEVPPDFLPEKEIEKWREQTRNLFLCENEAKIRSVTWLKNMLPDAMTRLGNSMFVILGIIRHAESYSLWLLSRGDSPYSFFLECIIESEEDRIFEGLSFSVNKGGDLDSCRKNQKNELWITENEFPFRLLDHLVIRHLIPGTMSGKYDAEWPLHIPLELITDQSDLPEI